MQENVYDREGLDLELVFVRGTSTAVQALLANQIHFIFSVAMGIDRMKTAD